MLQVTGTVVSTGAEAVIDIDMLNTKEKREDVSDWKSSELAGEFRTIIRRAEKWLKNHKEDKKVEELLYQLKKAILEDDDWQANMIEQEIEDYIG